VAEESEQQTENVEERSYEINSNLTSLEGLILNTYFNVINPTNVKKWLTDHVTFNRELRNVSRKLYNANGIYTNVIDYMTSLPTLDRVIYSTNKNHSRFKKNKEKFDLALKKIKDKLIARDILHKSGVDGTSFYYFETTEASKMPSYLSDLDVDQIKEINAADFNCSVTPLPTDYCSIVGRKNSSYLIAFDMSYFDQFTGNGRALKLKRYPKEIRDNYKVYRSDLAKKWAVLDNNRTITIKVRAKLEEMWGRPVGLSAFIDMLYDEYFIDTKRSILDEINSTIIYQTFPEGEKKGTSSLTQKQQESQHNNIKNALFSKGAKKGINFFSVASGTKLDKLITNIDFLKVKGEDDLIKRISTHLGFAGSLLNGDSGNFASQQSNIEMVSSEVFSWIEQIQDEFNKVINANIIKDPQVYVEMYYLPTTHVNRKEMVGHMKELYTHGGGSFQAWIAATGFNPTAYLAILDEEIDLDFDSKYQPHQTSFTKTDQEPGAPEKDSGNENTLKSKANGSNESPRA
jgi:hypothetical protein